MSAKKPVEEKVGSVTPFGLRLLPDLKARVEEAARQNNRSLNAEITARLEASFSIGEAEETYRALSGGRGEEGLLDRLQELRALIYQITDQARQAKRMTEPVAMFSKYGQIRDDDDHTIQPPPEEIAVTREELQWLRDDEREAEGKERRFGPRPTGEIGKRLDFLRERAAERRKLINLRRVFEGKEELPS